MATEIVQIIAAVCGALIVFGGLFSLVRQIVGREEPTSVVVEIGKLRLSTRGASVCIFTLGLLFVLLAACIPLFTPGASGEGAMITIRGKVVSPNPAEVRARVFAGYWVLQPQPSGEIVQTISPNLRTLNIELTAPGHNPTIAKVIERKKIQNGEIAVGLLETGEMIVSKPEVNRDLIVAAPTLPPMSEAGSF